VSTISPRQPKRGASSIVTAGMRTGWTDELGERHRAVEEASVARCGDLRAGRVDGQPVRLGALDRGIADEADRAVRQCLESEPTLGLNMRDEQARGCGGTRVGRIGCDRRTVGDREAAGGTRDCGRLRYQWQAVLRLGRERAESGGKQRRCRQPAPGISVRGCTHVDCSLYRLLTAAVRGM
jgi:hypothetical protein